MKSSYVCTYANIQNVFILYLLLLQFEPDKFSISCTGKLENGEDASFNWIRAKDLFQDPKILKHGHSRSDVNQGKEFFFNISTRHFPSQGDLLDCWLVSPMTALSEKTDLFEVATLLAILYL